MKLEKLKQDKKNFKLNLLVKDSDEVFLNTIRRLILEEVPTLAVENLEIKDNNSALYDEMLGLRLGLTPIKTDLGSYRFPENEAEIAEKSARCTLQIKLKAARNGYIYASDAESADPKCTFVYDQTPIIKLLPKQKVDVTMFAILGRGKEHAKWAPGVAFFRKEPVLKLSTVKNPEKLATQCTDGVFSISGKTVKINSDKIYDSQLLEYYSEIDEGVKLEYSDNFLLAVEGWGQLSCQEMLTQSAIILTEKAEEMEKLL
jgi:DNA-directed RNA polymerase subunit D